MSSRPVMDQEPELLDMLAILRAHIAEDESMLQALLVDARLDTFALLAMLCGRVCAYGTLLYGSMGELDAQLAAEQDHARRT